MRLLVALLSTILGMQALPIPEPDPKIAEERRGLIAQLEPSAARIFIAARAEQNGELMFRYRELRSALRDEFLSVLDRKDSYYDTPGVIGCVGDPYRIVLIWPDRRAESWFAPKCQRIMAAPGSSVRFDAALSLKGARALRRVAAQVTGPPAK